MRVPGYQIERLVAEGGMSSVYRAVQASLGRPIALKVLKHIDSLQQAERFLREARIVAALEHRNIVTIHDFGSANGRYYIAMEYLDGGTLADRIEQGLPAEQALELLEAIAGCLDFVHRRGVVHRDIKPGNILFHADGTPKLSDFGIARQLADDQEHTQDGGALGSPYYLSPEQAEGRPLDGRSDIYSLGIVFYQMLTGRRPYAESSHIETIVAHLSQPIPVLPEPFAAYQRLLEDMIAKDPADRIESAAELVEQVRALRAGQPYRARARSVAGRGPGLKDARIPLAVAILALAAGAGYWLLDSEPPPAASLTNAPSAAPTAAPNAAPNAAVSSPDPVATTPATGSALRAPLLPEQVPSAQAMTAAAPQPARSDQDGDEAGAGTVEPEHAVAADHAEATPPGTLEPPHRTAMETEPGQANDAPGASHAATSAARPPADSAPDPGSGPVETGALAVETAAVPADSDGTGPAPDDLAAQIDALMRQAEADLQALRLTRPAGNSAHDRYLEVLALEPRHAGALAGIDTIAARYAAMADKALAEDDAERAALFLRRGRRVQPDHPALAAIEASLARREAPPAEVEPAPVETAVETPQESLRGPGTGNIVKDFQRLWRSVFD